MYLDLDVILAELKVDDWERDRVVRAHQEIIGAGIELVPLRETALDAAMDLRAQYDTLNVFDGIHLGSALALDEPVVSTDTLYPEIAEIDHVDPRDMD